jgi:hypothetical protein
MAKRYTTEEKSDLIKVIGNLYRQGMSTEQVSEKLNELNLTPKNAARWNPMRVHQFRNNNAHALKAYGVEIKTRDKRKPSVTKHVVKRAKKPSVSPVSRTLIEAIITGAHTPQQAARIIMTYINE